MDYKVFYRKYRPKLFKDIIGQNYTIDIIKKSISNQKISHAYIFTGPRGTGKTSTAKIFAKAINCEQLVDGEPCGTCNSCTNFINNPDIIEIDAASNNGVDEVRELVNNVKIAPTNSKYKIYIIDEVHMMTQNAFNALLLTLEEPPKHVVFILATTNIENVPITILSRCQRFDFKKIDKNSLTNQIKKVCEIEKIEITTEAIEEIALLSEGGSRDALSLLDQLSTNKKITLDDIMKNYGTISNTFIKELFNAVLDNNIDKVIADFAIISNSSYDFKHFLKKIINYLIQFIIESKKSHIDYRLSYDEIKNIILELNNLFNVININVDAFQLIQIIFLKYMGDQELNVIIEKKIEKKISENINLIETTEMLVPEKIKTEIDEFIKIRINNCLSEAKKELLNELKSEWKFIEVKDPEILILQDTTIAVASIKQLILITDLKSTASLINKNYLKIEDFLNHKFKKALKIVALSKTDWDIEKKQYINNIKNGVKYTYIEEIELKEENTLNESIDSFASSIFDESKIEIK